MSNSVVLKIGGSALGDKSPDAEKVESFCSMIEALLDGSKDLKLGIVVGAGRVGGGYVDVARTLGVNEFQLDGLAIDVTRLNAKLIARGIGMRGPIPTIVDEASKIMQEDRFVVMGGTTPGHTTNTVAALLAEDNLARLVNVTRVGGIFDKDPNKYDDAKKLPKMTPDELFQMAAKYDDRRARNYFVFDLLAAKIIARSSVPTCIIGAEPSEVINACLGKKHSGTIVE